SPLVPTAKHLPQEATTAPSSSGISPLANLSPSCSKHIRVPYGVWPSVQTAKHSPRQAMTTPSFSATPPLASQSPDRFKRSGVPCGASPSVQTEKHSPGQAMTIRHPLGFGHGCGKLEKANLRNRQQKLY